MRRPTGFNLTQTLEASQSRCAENNMNAMHCCCLLPYTLR
jgi:hypothetical protein